MLKPVKERAEEASLKIIPILKEHLTDIGAEPFIDADGSIKAKVVWHDTAPKETGSAAQPVTTSETIVDSTSPSDTEVAG